MAPRFDQRSAVDAAALLLGAAGGLLIGLGRILTRTHPSSTRP